NRLPALGINLINIPVVPPEIDDLVSYYRRTDDTRSSRKFPLHAMELARRRARVGPGVCRVAAEHRLRVCRTSQPKEQKKKRRYFHNERGDSFSRWEKAKMRALHWAFLSCWRGEESQGFRAAPEKSFPGSRRCVPVLQNSARSHANRP